MESQSHQGVKEQPHGTTRACTVTKIFFFFSKMVALPWSVLAQN